jgi:hypothetical protein
MGAFRNLAGGTAAAVALVAGVASPAAAEDLHVTGSFTATGTLSTECSIFHQVVNGSGDWTELGTTTFTLDFCLTGTPTNPSPVHDGHFTATTADGTFAGDVTGTVEPYGPCCVFPLHLVLGITSGTGRFADATGQLALEGAFGAAAATAEGTVDGTISIPSPTPATKDDCKQGGWQHLTDEHGTPFRNQGECIAWVNHHT